MADRIILALDCGSTNLKAALHSPSLECLGEASESVVYTEHGPDCYEFDANEFWQTTVRVMKQACLQAGVGVSAVTDVALSSQAQSFLFVDEQGEPATPVFSWLDRTAVDASVAAGGTLGKGFHCHCSFSEPIPQLQLCKVRQCVDRNPGLAAKQVVSLPGWIAMRLGAPNTSDENLAAMGGLYSLAKRHMVVGRLGVCWCDSRPAALSRAAWWFSRCDCAVFRPGVPSSVGDCVCRE